MQFFNFPSKMFLKIFKIFFVAVSSAVKFFGLISRIAEGENTQTEVARSSLGSSGLVLRELGEPSVGDDLAPASSWHFGDGGKPGRDVGELQTSGRRQAARQLSADLEGYVAHGGKHRDAAMPQPRLAAAGEVLQVPISRGAARSTEANKHLTAQLVLDCAQPRCSVQAPVAPGRANEAILEEHADDCQHGLPSPGKVGWQLIGLLSPGSREARTLKPKSPAAALVPTDWSCERSQKAP